MHHQIIHSTPSWWKKDAHYNCVLVAFLSFSHNDTVYPCALIDCFKHVGWGPDPVTGMWRVHPELVSSKPIQSVVHIDTILRNVHLIPVFGTGSIPHHLHYSKSLDVFSSYYVNKYADHHSFEVI
ncbi:hypothetical protein EI94DRAFT_1772541 [Lactarius quietus]|nr:hypothetical protein EI94DRAFT_1772541 [Lactarius quietus]